MQNSKNIKIVKYWRSLSELSDNTGLLKQKLNEFSPEVSKNFDLEKLPLLSRRKFLSLLGATAALSMTSCTGYQEQGEVVPYNVRPEEITLGKPNYYASACTGCSEACGILVKTREARPVKVDGNPEHPVNQGKICAKGQASILDLYDPERITEPLKNYKNLGFIISNWQTASNEIISSFDRTIKNNQEIAVIAGEIISPTTKKVLDDFLLKYKNAKIYSYKQFNELTRIEAWKKSYNKNMYPLINWDNAKVIVSLEADFLGKEGNVIENSRLFFKNRDIVNNTEYNKLYSIESNMSITGSIADYRLSLRSDAFCELVISLVNEVSNQLNLNIPEQFKGYSLKEFSHKFLLDYKVLKELTSDLCRSKGKSIVYAGYSQPETVHIAVNYLNQILENNNLYSFKKEESILPFSSKEELENLSSKMNSGKIGAIIHFDTNPVYHFPQELNYSVLIKNIPMVVSLSQRENETTALSNFVLPIHHDFESWNDFKTRNGIYTLQQAIISPLYNTRQKESVLLSWISNNYTDEIYHKYLQNNWKNNIHKEIKSGNDFKVFWYSALNNGFVSFSESGNKEELFFNHKSLDSLKVKATKNDYLLFISENIYLGDGKFSSNGWLQELPHPISKIVWDNYAAISPKTADELKVISGDEIEISIDNKKQVFPVFIQPGIAYKVISIETGYGRTNSGTISESVGFNPNTLLSYNNDLSQYIYNNISVKKTGNYYQLVSTNEHHSLNDLSYKNLQFERDIIYEENYSNYINKPKDIQEKNQPTNINKIHEYKDAKWGMAIDTNKCTACNACVSACNVENNIPVIGKEQVSKSREMQWIRIDSYYSGAPESPKINHQPMLCQQCDNAPCEAVCPVEATTHSPDGLNQMVYNRCIGTRYCSNNCPYKVRRFNFFNYRNDFAKGYYKQTPVDLINNPEVTVRDRGVMEKCTFCIQRIMETHQQSIKDGKSLKEYEIKTACQQACPTDAIVFGDQNNAESPVNKYINHKLGYQVLKDLNTRPNITYLAKLRNNAGEKSS